jgi:hypothetical protein
MAWRKNNAPSLFTFDEVPEIPSPAESDTEKRDVRRENETVFSSKFHDDFFNVDETKGKGNGTNSAEKESESDSKYSINYLIMFNI